jgi:two-component system, OmpR family, sensor kinase
MSEPVWYKSLYWRIALGFVAMLAALLLAQGFVLLWLTDQIVGRSSRTPPQLAEAVSSELSAALAQNPNLSLDGHILEKFGRIYQPFLVIMRDGRMASNRPGALPPNFARAVQGRWRRGGFGGGGRDGGFPRGPRNDDGPFPGRPGPPEGAPPPPGDGRPPDGGPGGPREGGQQRLAETAPIVVDTTELGMVFVPVNPPPVFVAIRELGPTLTWAGLALLAIGAAGASLLIFRPAHRRLRALEQAARELGEGHIGVRAAEGGGDEVSSLAHAFNRMAEDLSTRAAALTASDRARRQLLADVSHELMTPLAAIRGYTETLAMPELALEGTTRQRYLGIIGEETQKLEGLIGDLLDLARLEGGGGTLQKEDVPVKELFRRVSDRHGPALRARHIMLDVTVQPAALTLYADGQRLEQAVQNLAANALRHTPENGRVTLAAEETPEGVRIAVRDTGPGIPPEHLPHIFERFYKADASRTAAAQSGSGLGLSIVQAIVERHGGTITAANAPEGGAIFEIRLPRNEQTSD